MHQHLQDPPPSLRRPASRRPIAVLVALTLVLGTMALAASPASAQTVTVTPNQNLSDGQSVTVSGSGLEAGLLAVVQCGNATSAGEPLPGNEPGTADCHGANQLGTGTILVEGPSFSTPYTARSSGIGDQGRTCISATEANFPCVIVVATTDGNIQGSQPIYFGEAAPPTGPAPDLETPPGAIDTADFCANVEDDSPFDDVPANHTFADTIACLAFTEITLGLADGVNYGPAQTVRRDQMASFIARLMDTAVDLAALGAELQPLPPAPSSSQFTDLISGSTHNDNINRLAEAGITLGGPQGRPANEFGPALQVTRSQMASFINRAFAHLTGDGLPCDSDYYADVVDNPNIPDAIECDINAITTAGIAQGDTSGNYNPGASTTRGQMSAFMIRSLAVMEARGLIIPAGQEPSNATFFVTPQAPTFMTVSTAAGTEHETRGYREYSVAVPEGTTVSIGLITDPNVRISDTNIIMFRDEDGTPNRADGLCDTLARIQLVNGAGNFPIADGNDCVTGVSPVDGVVTFTINSQTTFPPQAVKPVVWIDSAPTGSLALDPATCVTITEVTPEERFCRPAEPFGVGGTTLFAPEEATAGIHNTQFVVIPIAEVNFFTAFDGANSRTFNYGPDDTFRYSAFPFVDLPLTLEQFEAHLSQASAQVNVAGVFLGFLPDIVNVNYNPDGPSVFTIVADRPEAPANVQAVASGDGIRVTWDAVPNLAFTEYRIYRATVTNGVVGAYALAGTVATKTVTTFDDTGLGSGTYRYVVLSANAYSTSANSPNATATVDVGAGAIITDQRVTTDTDVVGLLDAGDEIRIRFSQPMTTTTTNAVFFRWSDGDSVYQVACTDDAACSWHDHPGVTNGELRMALGGNPTLVSGTANGLDISGDGATMTLVSAGVRTATDAGVNLADSTDTRLNIAAALP
jgi:hypothetical protein